MAASYEAGRSRVVLAIARPGTARRCSGRAVGAFAVLQGALGTSCCSSGYFDTVTVCGIIVGWRFATVTHSRCGSRGRTEPWWGEGRPGLQRRNGKRECRDSSGNTYFTYFH